jgi:hypothetical protein
MKSCQKMRLAEGETDWEDQIPAGALKMVPKVPLILQKVQVAIVP